MTKITLVTNTDKSDLLAQAAAAVTRLDAIVATTGTMTTAQLTAAIKDMAKYEKAIIKRLMQII